MSVSYEQTTWVSEETPLSADNMNRMEQGIADCAEAVNELNDNMQDFVITKENVGTETFTISASGTLMLTSDYVDIPATPDGYTRIAYFYHVSGDPNVVSVAINNPWLKNTRSSESNELTPHCFAIFVRNFS